MLVLSRKVGERIVVGDGIIITVVRLGQGSVRIGVEAPNEMAIMRQELIDQGEAATPDTTVAAPLPRMPNVPPGEAPSPADALQFII